MGEFRFNVLDHLFALSLKRHVLFIIVFCNTFKWNIDLSRDFFTSSHENRSSDGLVMSYCYHNLDLKIVY